MKLSYMLFAALLVAGPIANASAAAPQSTTTASGDKAIESRIQQRIARDSSLKDFSIKVSVNDRVATLSGTVATEADRGKLAEIATASGATTVENHLVADLNAGKRTKGTTGEIKEKTAEAIDKTKEFGEKVVDKTKDAAEKTGEVATDTWITGRIKAKMVPEDLLKDSDVHVSTNKHVVTLSGYVMSSAGRAKAAEIARSIEGVKRVVNKITVK